MLERFEQWRSFVWPLTDAGDSGVTPLFASSRRARCMEPVVCYRCKRIQNMFT